MSSMNLRLIARGLLKRSRFNPMTRVVKQVIVKGIKLDTLTALEIFGGSGELHTDVYAPLVRKLDVWEIDGGNVERLKKNIPLANVKMTDSYKEISKSKSKYDLIVCDNPMIRHGDHFEHFDIVDDLSRVMKKSVILVLNIIPCKNIFSLKRYPRVFVGKHRERRQQFYGVENPDRLPLSQVVATYKRIFSKHGFRIKWYFFQKRYFSEVSYLVLKLER